MRSMVEGAWSLALLASFGPLRSPPPPHAGEELVGYRSLAIGRVAAFVALHYVCPRR
jgi:hypothetical protein